MRIQYLVVPSWGLSQVLSLFILTRLNKSTGFFLGEFSYAPPGQLEILFASHSCFNLKINHQCIPPKCHPEKERQNLRDLSTTMIPLPPIEAIVLCVVALRGYPFHEFTHCQPSPSNESPPQEYGFAKVLLREKSMVNKPFTRSYFWAWWKGVGWLANKNTLPNNTIAWQRQRQTRRSRRGKWRPWAETWWEANLASRVGHVSRPLVN